MATPIPNTCLLISLWIVAAYVITSTTALLTAMNGNLASPGNSANLQCQTDQPNAQVQFLRKGVVLGSDGTGKYSTSNTSNNDNTNATLTINHVGEQDLGEYQCRIMTTQETVSVFLYSKPVVASIQVPASLIEGETLHLTCSAWGLPAPVCTWMKEDTVLTTSDPGVSFADLMTSSNATVINAQLTIVRMNRSDQTDYTCSAFDGDNKTNVTAYVRVKDRLAAVWPSIGIVVVIVLTIIIIIIAERRRRQNEAKLHPQ